MFRKKDKDTNIQLRELLNTEKENVHILTMYTEVLNEVLTAVTKGFYFPLCEKMKRFTPLYSDLYTEEQSEMIDAIKENLSEKLRMAGYTNSGEDYWIRHKQTADANAILSYRTDDKKYIFDTIEECNAYNMINRAYSTTIMHSHREESKVTSEYNQLVRMERDNKTTVYVELVNTETIPFIRKKHILFKFVFDYDTETVKLYKKNGIRKKGETSYISKISDAGWYPYWKEAYVFVKGSFVFPADKSKGAIRKFICDYFNMQNEQYKSRQGQYNS